MVQNIKEFVQEKTGWAQPDFRSISRKTNDAGKLVFVFENEKSGKQVEVTQTEDGYDFRVVKEARGLTGKAFLPVEGPQPKQEAKAALPVEPKNKPKPEQPTAFI